MNSHEKIILEYCKDGPKLLKALYSSIPKTSLYRCAKKLVIDGDLEKIKVSTAIPVMAVNAYERRLDYMPIRKHFMILHASIRHIT
jgi:hypothetical protein